MGEPKSGHHSLAQALHLGGISFLTLRDGMAVLHTCTMLRDDASLAQTALLASNHGAHLFQKCYSDWFDLVPKRIVGDEDLDSRCDGSSAHAEGTAEKTLKTMLDASGHKWFCTQLVSLAMQVEHFILPACEDKRIFLSSYGDRTASIPVAISLWDYLPATYKRGGKPCEWTRESVRDALNAVHTGFGDRFTSQDPADAFVSQFGAHWDSIREVDGAAGDVACSLCDMAVAAVADYKKQVALLRVQCDAEMSKVQTQCTEQGDELDARAEEIERKYFPQGDDEEVYLREEVDNILEHIVNSGRVHFPPFPQGSGLSPEDLFGALEDVYGYPPQCRSVSQPLKRFLLKYCKFTNRIKFDWIPRSAFATPHGYRSSKIELVGGVTPSGFLCGAFVVIFQSL